MNDRLLESDRFPYLPLQVAIGDEVWNVEALLDTGFDGAIVLPEALVPHESPPEGYSTWWLADGSMVDAPSYRGMVRVGQSDPIEVAITILGDEILAGRDLIAHFRIVLDHGRRLVVEP